MTEQSETNQSESKSTMAKGDEERCAEPRRDVSGQRYVNSAVEQTGKLLRSLSERVRSVAESLREEQGPQQRVGRTVERVAKKLESSADYLSGTSTTELRESATGMIKRYPLRSLGVIFGVGLLLGTALRRRGV
ncbi:MAG: hypothetical protein RL518_1768 [Pseudomonadota bacterium]|jgi:ElaB/YqjD/DUF883 family membrane-anchored ribosome-binding protein